MRTTSQGLRLIGSFEGLRLKAYRNFPGEPWTCGYGHTAKVGPNTTCTPARALRWLKQDVRTAERAVDKGVTVGLNQNRFNALVSWVFNVGVGAFQASTLRRELNKGRYSAVPRELLKWTRVNGKVVKGLLNRRRAEIRLWNRRPA